MNFGVTEILIIVFIVLLLFGGKRIPGLARSIGASISSFKKGINESKHSDSNNDSSKQ